MEYDEVMQRIRMLGIAKTSRVRGQAMRNGSGSASLASLRRLKDQVQTDHELAKRLWSSDDEDAQAFALMIADPEQMTQLDLDRWVKAIHDHALSDIFVTNLVLLTSHAHSKMEKWTTSQDEWVGRAGWQLLSQIAMKDNELPDGYFEEYLKVIRKNIHSRKGRTKEAMNNALIAIGLRNPNLENRALAVAADIGTVEIVHGKDLHQAPDAVLSIKRAKRKRKNRRRSAQVRRGTRAKG